MPGPRPIATLGSRLAEAGRIRLGVKDAKAKGGRRAIDTFRFTSPREDLIRAVAAHLGGRCVPWNDASAKPREQFQVITPATAFDVAVVPGGFSQDYELWGGGYVERRCDGEECELVPLRNDETGDRHMVPCICTLNNAMECSIKTRMSVLLPWLPLAGVWRLESSGWNATEELPGIVSLIEALGARGQVCPARLVLSQRAKTVKRRGKVFTKTFVVPVLELTQTPAELAAGGTAALALEASAPDAFGELEAGEDHDPDAPDPVPPPPPSAPNVFDDVADAEVVSAAEVALRRDADFWDLDPDRFVDEIRRNVGHDEEAMAKMHERIAAGRIVPLRINDDGTIDWERRS